MEEAKPDLFSSLVALAENVLHGGDGESSADVQPAGLWELARQHKILVYPARGGTEALSGDCAASLHHTRLIHIGRFLRLVHELISLCQLFAERGLAAAPFKGPALSQQLYGDCFKRHFVDLDIFVRPEDAGRAVQALRERGYQNSMIGEVAWPDVQARFSSIELVKKEGRMMVDLQWDLCNRYAPSWYAVETYHEHTQPLALEKRMVPAFDNELTFYILGTHGAKNGYGELRYVQDYAAFLLKYPGFDYGAFLAKAERLGIDRMFSVGAVLSEALFRVAVPAGFAPFINKAVIRLVEDIKQRLRAGPAIPVGWHGFVTACRFRSRLRELLRYGFFRLKPTKGDLGRGSSYRHSYWDRLKKITTMGHTSRP